MIVTEKQVRKAVWDTAQLYNRFDNLNSEVPEILKNWMKAYKHLEKDGAFEIDGGFFTDSIEGEVQLYYSLTSFEAAHRNAVVALKKMYAVWIDGEIDVVKNYPDYLPSFDEFIMDFELIKPLDNEN